MDDASEETQRRRQDQHQAQLHLHDEGQAQHYHGRYSSDERRKGASAYDEESYRSLTPNTSTAKTVAASPQRKYDQLSPTPRKSPALPTVDSLLNQFDNSPSSEGLTKSTFVASQIQTPPSTTVAIKLLVSNNMAGSIIGRSGQTISELQQQSSCRIKLGKNGDCFPGTTDRVCLIQGLRSNVMLGIAKILQILYKLQLQQMQINFGQDTLCSGTSPTEQQGWSKEGSKDSTGEIKPGTSNTFSTAFAFVVRVLVPIPACGMLIGRGGSNIKSMTESTGVTSIRLSSKESELLGSVAGTSGLTPSATAERVLTISGPDESCCVKCVYSIIDGMTLHPDTCRYGNMTTSYTKFQVSPAHLTFAIAAPSNPMTHNPSNSASLAGGATATPGIHQQQYLNLQPIAQQQEQIPGSADTATRSQLVESIENSKSTFAPFGMPVMLPTPMSLPKNVGSYASHPSQQQLQPFYVVSVTSSPTLQQHLKSDNRSKTIPSLQSLAGSANAFASTTVQMASMQLEGSSAHQGNPPASGNMLQLSSLHTHQQPVSVQIAVPEAVIGSILGRNGRTLTELQLSSNCRIRVSQRGDFVPGTTNRIVTVTGPNAPSVAMAQHLICQRGTRNRNTAKLSSVWLGTSSPPYASDKESFIASSPDQMRDQNMIQTKPHSEARPIYRHSDDDWELRRRGSGNDRASGDGEGTR